MRNMGCADMELPLDQRASLRITCMQRVRAFAYDVLMLFSSVLGFMATWAPATMPPHAHTLTRSLHHVEFDGPRWS